MNTFFIILPLIIICFLGYLTVRVKLFNKAQMDSLSAVSFNLLVPLFLFNSTYKTNLEIALSPQWFLSFYIPVIASFIVIFMINKYRLKHKNDYSALTALSATYSNNVLVAIPIVASILSETAAGSGFVLIAFHSAVLFTLTEILVNNSGFKTLIRAGKNPIVLSILGGFSLNLLGVSIPDLLLNPLTTLSASAIPLALFGLGASMYYLPFKGNRTVALINSVYKLMLLPAFVYLTGTYVFELTSEQIFIAVMLSASPVGVGAYIMAKKHNIAADISASAVVLSTLLCIFSYLFWINFLL
jgi:predicted permease